MSRVSRIGRRRLRLKHAASLCTRRAHAAEFSEAPAQSHVSTRRRSRSTTRPSNSWTRANRAAARFRVGATEARSSALPFHISSRAKARRDRDKSSEADWLRTPPLRDVVSRVTTSRFIPRFSILPAALGGSKWLRLTTELIRWKSDDPVCMALFPMSAVLNSKPVTSTLSPWRYAPIPRARQNCRRSGSAASLWPRAADGASVLLGPVALITESHRKRGIAPTMES